MKRSRLTINKEPFCLNSKRWLALLFFIPKLCPRPTDNLMHCEDCGYYELRIPTTYLKERIKIFKIFGGTDGKS